jgi:hypothetical protein
MALLKNSAGFNMHAAIQPVLAATVGGSMHRNNMQQYTDTDQVLLEILRRSEPTQEELQMLSSCVEKLENMAQTLGPKWHISPFGSSANGFVSAGCDLDVTCYQENMLEQQAQAGIQELHFRLLPLLRQHPEFQVLEEISNARVPILKLRFGNRLDVDLSCHNPEALQNTHLLRSYAKMNHLVRLLVKLVKLWAKSEGVCGAAIKHLSSYSLTLMVIYFLQVSPRAMPCLPIWAFSFFGPSQEVQNARWAYTESLSSLLLGFFNFYGKDEFAWGSEVVSIRLGRRKDVSDPDFFRLQGRRDSGRIHIEDPFLHWRNLNCVLSLEREQQFRSKLNEAAISLKMGIIPPALSRLLQTNQSPAVKVPAQVATPTQDWVATYQTSGHSIQLASKQHKNHLEQLPVWKKTSNKIQQFDLTESSSPANGPSSDGESTRSGSATNTNLEAQASADGEIPGPPWNHSPQPEELPVTRLAGFKLQSR